MQQFRDDTDVLADFLELLPLDEMSKKFDFTDKDINVIPVFFYLLKKNLLTKLLQVALVEDRKPKITDIPKAIKFYREMVDGFGDIIA